MSFMEKLFGNFSDKELKRIKPIANKVLELEPEMQKLTASTAWTLRSTCTTSCLPKPT